MSMWSMVRVQSTLNIEFLPLTEPLLVANLVLKIFELQFSNSCRLGHGYRGYYIAENGEHRWYDLYRAIGDAFAQAGLATSGAEPSPFSDEETGRYLGSFVGACIRRQKLQSNEVNLGYVP